MDLIALKNYKYSFGVIVIIICLVVYKFSFLSLPYYWDEAWPYGVGVHILYNHGLSLIPGAVPPFIARGHPLMFHFLAAAWMKIFGTGLFSGHCFAMFVSVLTIVIIYKFCKAFFSERVGFVACLLFCTQAVFITQSAFLMPEVLMAFWTMICFYTYFKGNKILFIVFTTSMLLTKESGVVFIVTLFFSQILQFVFTKERNASTLFKKVSLIIIPAILASINFIINKIEFGWFLFPFYMDYISSGWKGLTEKLPDGAAYLFIYYGRNGFSIFIILSIIIFIYRKIKFTQNEKRIIAVLSCFIVLFLIFSSVNYFIERYLLCAFPPFVIIGALLIDKTFLRTKILYSLIIVGLAVTNIFFYAYRNRGGDQDYSPSIIADMRVINFCEKENLYKKNIFAPSVLRIDFSEPYSGYIPSKLFNNIQWEFSNNTEYCIFSSDEYDSTLIEKIKKENNLKLIQRYEQGYAWREIYEVVRQ